MPNYAVVVNDLVVNVIVADTIEVASAVTQAEVLLTEGEPWVGWHREDGEWVAPIEETVEPIVDSPLDLTFVTGGNA